MIYTVSISPASVADKIAITVVARDELVIKAAAVLIDGALVSAITEVQITEVVATSPDAAIGHALVILRRELGLL